jgi:RNase adapter protein RapZ
MIRRFVIVTGLSGAGKSRALKSFEDLGFYCLDNLPPTLLPQVVEIAETAGRDRIAVAPDVQIGPLGNTVENVAAIAADGVHGELLFLDASDETLVRRFSETRRKHPLGTRRLTDAIATERAALSPLRDRADRVWDTSTLTPAQLKKRITEAFAPQPQEHRLNVTLISFGYKYGLPLDADIVFDVRFLPNPYYVDQLRDLCGTDAPVAAYLEAIPETQAFLDHAQPLLDFLIPHYIREGKAQLTIAIGCTGGRHRSVYLAQRLRRTLSQNAALEVGIVARDVNR